ncbi:COG1361 family protein [Thermococcus prieurii]
MKRVVLFSLLILAFLVTLHGASASSFSGWVYVPGTVSANNVTLHFEDVSLTGELLGRAFVNGTYYGDFALRPGSEFKVGNVVLHYYKAFVGSKVAVLVGFDFLNLTVGESVTLGYYRFQVVAVGPNGATIRAYYLGTEKDFTASSFKVGHVSVTVSSYPEVFNGYLKVGEEIHVDGHYLVFEKAWVENSTGTLVKKLLFNVDGKNYTLTAGEKADVGVFHVDVKDLVVVTNSTSESCVACSSYADVTVNFIGASLAVKTVPDFEFSLQPGQTRNVGPYLFKYLYPFSSSAQVELMNNCGQKITGAKLTNSTISAVLYYGGVVIALDSVASDGTATFYGFLNPSEFPNVTKTANLLMTLKVGEGRQYVPMNVNLTLTNTGTVPLSHISVVFSPGTGFRVLGSDSFEIASLPPNKTLVLHLRVLPMKEGTLKLGTATAVALAPFELACSHCTVLHFTSNDPAVRVRTSALAYSIALSAPPKVEVGSAFPLVVTVRNTGNVKVPANVSVRIPAGLAVESSSGLKVVNGSVLFAVELKPGEVRKLKLNVVPYVNGTAKITARVSSLTGLLNTTSITLNVSTPEGGVVTVSAPCNGTVTTSTVPGKEVTVTKTEYKTKTVTSTTTSSVPYTPLRTKLIWLVLGSLIGAGAIIAIAWYQARSS